MYFVTHVLAGAALATRSPGPAAAIAGGLGTHLLLDWAPHHDYRRPLTGFIDFFAGLALVAALSLLKGSAQVWWGALGAGLPDLEVALFGLGLIRSRRVLPLFPSHRGLSPHVKVGLLPGVLTQAAVAAVSAWLLAT
ncbi:MAG: hypothetical protein K6T75_10065 [Acetobacteraceae bacterium]|nr:hypothetical protein [Acetobacteraceae bacterium]